MDQDDDTRGASKYEAVPEQVKDQGRNDASTGVGGTTDSRARGPAIEQDTWPVHPSDAPTQVTGVGVPAAARSSEPPMPWAEQQKTNPYRVGDQHDPVVSEPRRRGGIGWIVPAVIGLAAVVAFALVWFFLSAKDETPPAASNHSVTSSTGSAQTSPSSRTEAAASFPADSSAICGAGRNVEPLNVDGAQLKVGSNTSCQFARDVIGDVKDWVSTHPDATQFKVSALSQELNGQRIYLTCTREHHLSECRGGRSVHLWVQDPAQ